MQTLWIIIWRFQPLHKGHLLLINTSLRQQEKTLIFIGSSNKSNAENPYSYNTRKEIIKEEIQWNWFKIEELPDFPSDLEWKNKILEYIPKQITKIVLYCWDQINDSAVKSLKKLEDILPFELDIIEIPRSIIPVSATQVREWIKKNNIQEVKKYLWEKTLDKIQEVKKQNQ